MCKQQLPNRQEKKKVHFAKSDKQIHIVFAQKVKFCNLKASLLGKEQKDDFNLGNLSCKTIGTKIFLQ